MAWSALGSCIYENYITVNYSAPVSYRDQLADKRNQRETMAVSLWDKVKRIQSAIKGTFGDDSSQYEMVGGIRMSDRKFRTHKRVPAAE